MTSTYLQAMNQIVSSHVNRMENTLVFGENLDRGSFISGLSKNLAAGPTRVIKNVGNCEYTHCGVGFGLMMSGVNAVLFVKQLDFMLLGMDHFVSTLGVIRATKSQRRLGSFTIVTAVYDQGFQGPQSSFRGINEIASMSGANAFLLQESEDATQIVSQELLNPGFRFIALSQKMSANPVRESPVLKFSSDHSVFQFADGTDLSIVCFGFSLTEGRTLLQSVIETGRSASLFSINYVLNPNWRVAIENIARNKRLVIIDDTRSATSLAFRFLTDVLEVDRDIEFTVIRDRETVSTAVSEELFSIDVHEIVSRLFR